MFRIALIDDNPDDRTLAARELMREYPDASIEQVMNQQELQHMLTGEAPDVVVTDYQLQWSNGLDVLHAVKERYPDVPVVMFTNTGTEEIAVEAMKSGLDDYILKSPHHYLRLALAVRSVAERAHARRHTARLETAAAIVAEASDVLAASLELETTTATITRLIVPRLADMCTLDLLDEHGALYQIASSASDPTRAALMGEFRAPYPAAESSARLPNPLHTGQLRVFPDVSPEQLLDFAQDVAHLQLLQAIAPGSALIAPLTARGHTLGILTLLMTDQSRRRFSQEDVPLVDDLVRRVALFVDNARLYAEARAAIRIRDQFLGIASHELRTPLTTVNANLQLASRRIRNILSSGIAVQPSTPPTETDGVSRSAGQDERENRHKGASLVHDQLIPVQSMLDRALRQSDRLERLVGNLLDVSRIAAGHFEIQFEPVDLVAQVRESVEEQRLNWHDRVITLDLPDAPLLVNGDADHIGQVVSNFLVNALKYSRRDTPVTVAVRQQDHNVRVEVDDQGIGIAPGELSRIWDRFYRAEGVQHQSGSGVGLGLGLHISKTIIERHGGYVGVVSEPGKGSTFWFTLPLLRPSAQPAEDP